MDIRKLLFKEDMAEIYFPNHYQSKNHKQRYKKRKLLYKAVRKCQIEAPKAVGSSLRYLIVRGRWQWVILAVSIAQLFYLYFVTNLREKQFIMYVRLQLNLPPVPLKPVRF